MKTLFILLILSATLMGCSPPDAQHNADVLSNGGTPIGHLPDGRLITLYVIDGGCGNDDRVYVVEKSTTVSTNWREGKHDAHSVTVGN